MTTFTARSPLDLLALVPVVIGFHPEDSVVLLTFGQPDSFHARIDLPDDLDGQAEVTRVLAGAVRRHRVPLVAVLVYSADVAAAGTMAEGLLEALLDDGVDVVDVLRVDDDHYHQWDGDRFAPLGIAFSLDAHPFTAAGVFEGRVVHESRAALADSLIGTDEDDEEKVGLAAARLAATWPDEASTQEAVQWRARQADFVRTVVDRQVGPMRRRLSAGEVGQLAFLVNILVLRDEAWSAMTRDTAARHVDLWREVVRRVPRDLLPGPAGLLAFAAWLAGEGALAWCAVDRCLEVDPDHRLAHRIAEALEHAVPPSTWEDGPGTVAQRAG